jgi:ubiquitin-like 1-activating enzyme E1 B
MASALGEVLAGQVAEAKVLVVGTGGIGCELLKNLVLTGFKDIVAVSIPNNAHQIPEFEGGRS